MSPEETLKKEQILGNSERGGKGRKPTCVNEQVSAVGSPPGGFCSRRYNAQRVAHPSDKHLGH